MLLQNEAYILPPLANFSPYGDCSRLGWLYLVIWTLEECKTKIMVQNSDKLWLCLQQVLVGEGSGEEQLFSPEHSAVKDNIDTELERYVRKIKVPFPIYFKSILFSDCYF